LQYRAANLICGEDQHAQLDKNERRTFDLLPGITQYAKILIQGKQPPCKLFFEYPEDL